MPSPKGFTCCLLFLSGVALAAANLWFTAARSTISLALDGVISSVDVGLEKHPGRDDVYWITLQGQSAIQVDELVYRAVTIGQRLTKPRWSQQLRIDDRMLVLTWSRDYGAMLKAMPTVLFILAVTIAVAAWRVRENPGS